MSKNNETKMNNENENNKQENEIQPVLNVRDQRKAERRAKKEARAKAEAENPTWRTKLKKVIVPVGVGIGSFILGGIVASLGKDDEFQTEYDSPEESQESEEL